MTSYTYPYHETYGGEEVDTIKVSVEKVQKSHDGRSIQLFVEPLRKGYVHELDASGLHSIGGESLLHPLAYYTLNEIPKIRSFPH